MVRPRFLQEVMQLDENSEVARKLSEHVRFGSQGGYVLISWATPFDWNAHHATASAQVWLQTIAAAIRPHSHALLPVWFCSRAEDQATYEIVLKLAA
jgi:hypothetical protein